MKDIRIRIDGRAGIITLNRPQTLNALTYPMCHAITGALNEWRTASGIDLVIFDAVGDRAFCVGGDIADMYRCGKAGDFAYGQNFWRDEYRMNAAIHEFTKPVVSFLQGYTMGGGVGIGCHGSHRIVGPGSRIAMPECSIGLVPDVGGSYILARAPGRLGEFLAVTGHRMGPAEAIFTGFADHYIEETNWCDLKRDLCRSGNQEAIAEAAQPVPEGDFSGCRAQVDTLFSLENLTEIDAALRQSGTGFAVDCRKRMEMNSPLSMACAVALVRMQRNSTSLRDALSLEYRFVYRSLQHSDFLEGIRARIVDKDNRAAWRHSDPGAVTAAEVSQMLAPLGSNELTWDGV
ncbi:MAG: enoyl-CoA hydratase/isomerase family protein [Rhodobacteraceae bacterium]|nr:enoyl-CoA hydratase/isomerase family protein [Paracoccaceae bacterium]